MMTMYMSPYRRRAYQMMNGDRVARDVEMTRNEVHIPLDIKDEKDAFVIYAIVPGLEPDDVNIEIINNAVNINGEFVRAENDEDVYLRTERPTGTFRRFLRFPVKLESAKAEAKLENGILALRIPKVAEELPKTIKVKAA